MSDNTTDIPEGERYLIEGIEALKAVEGRIEPDHIPGGLSVAHADYLASQAVDVELAVSLGVRSLVERSETKNLPEPWCNFANLPAILFPWVSEDGRTEYQVRPDDPTTDQRGRLRKYMFRKGMTPVLWAVRPVGDSGRLVLVEGTKQCLSAASYAPPDTGVYGIAGCRSWQVDGSPIPDLAVVDGKDVVVILDADASTNLDVYLAGTGLAEALVAEGATSVKFGRLAAGGKAGLDDILAGRTVDRRASYLSRIISTAKPKPADAKPKPKKKGSVEPGSLDRATIVCNRDRLEVINELTSAMIDKWDGRELFNHGGVISRLKGQSMHPIDRGTARDLIQETAITVDEIEDQQGIRYTFTWPDPNSIAATMSRAEKFSPLDRVSHAPFVRPDGTIATTPGYDESTRTVLIPDPALEGLEVPEAPSPDQVRQARDFIMTEWLGDFPFGSDADRANALALAVTPAIRGMLPRVPLAVVDGLQMGVGKNLLADCLLTVYTGEPARPMNFVDDKDELRKQITSAFRTGAEFFVFDEAHTVEGAALAQALTASTWQDRILGVSTMAEFPNRVTWMSLGNNVQVKGDVTRRVYRIALRPTYADPQDRKASSFRHPGQSGLDLMSWTRKHRRDLLTAILTLVRAWYAAGKPGPPDGATFGSFETWQRYAGGIVGFSGMTGFLANLKVWRSESDFDSQYWSNHIQWLRDRFGDSPFRAAEVAREAMSDLSGFLAPPKLDDPTDKGFPKALGEAYARMRGRRYNGRYLDRMGGVSGHVSLWTVRGDDDTIPPPPEPEAPLPTPEPGPESDTKDGDMEPDTMAELIDAIPDLSIERGGQQFPDPPHNEHGEARGCEESDTVNGETDCGELVTLDLEAGDAEDLYRHGPGYVRLAGAAYGDRAVAIGDGPLVGPWIRAAVRMAEPLTGHNIMAFDLPALVREGVLDMPEVHRMARDGRLFDGLLAARHLDPPMAREKGVDAARRHDLDSLGKKYGLGDKLGGDVKPLVKKYGGWGNIPVSADDPDEGRAADAGTFRRYLTRDVELSRALYHKMMGYFGASVPDYLYREHQVAALATQISVNGFRVDVEELARRVDNIRADKREALKFLSTRYGIPLTDPKGKPYAAPLSSKIGKEALTKALTEAGATSLWRTEKSKDLMVGADHMDHLADEYGYLPAVVDIARLVHRVVSARTVYETIQNNLCGDRVHPKVAFKQSTGRWSLTEPGLTVMGKHGGRHVERMVLLPDPGDVILTVDLSQVDMRAVAGLAQDPAYIDMLRHDDPHAELAKLLFGDAGRRQEAKATGHGWNYGESLRRIAQENEIDPEIVHRFDRSMRERFPRLMAWREEVREWAASGQLLDNGFGRPMRPDPQRAHTQGPALMGQGAARDIMMEGLLRLASAHPEILPMLRAQVHDEIVLSVPKVDAPDVARAVKEALTFEWKGVPITSDVGPLGRTWGHCYEHE